MTAKDIYSLPNKSQYTFEYESGMNILEKFLRQIDSCVGFDPWDYNYKELDEECKFIINIKLQKIHDQRRSTSLYVFQFDNVDFGWLIASGREERDYLRGELTDKEKLSELFTYLIAKDKTQGWVSEDSEISEFEEWFSRYA